MGKRGLILIALAVFACASPFSRRTPAQTGAPAPPRSDGPTNGLWSFAVSGDSRNCGDVVMPAIAAGVMHSGPSFYWLLGDLRAIPPLHEDMRLEPQHAAAPMTI